MSDNGKLERFLLIGALAVGLLWLTSKVFPWLMPPAAGATRRQRLRHFLHARCGARCVDCGAWQSTPAFWWGVDASGGPVCRACFEHSGQRAPAGLDQEEWEDFAEVRALMVTANRRADGWGSA